MPDDWQAVKGYREEGCPSAGGVRGPEARMIVAVLYHATAQPKGDRNPGRHLEQQGAASHSGSSYRVQLRWSVCPEMARPPQPLQCGPGLESREARQHWVVVESGESVLTSRKAVGKVLMPRN